MPQTADSLSAFAGLALSLMFSYIPRFSGAYARLDTTTKSLIMAILLALVAFGSLLRSCHAAPIMGPCLSESWDRYLQAFLSALVANVGTHHISPETAEVKAAKAESKARAESKAS